MAERKANWLERFLYGPQGRSAVDAGELKGLFPVDHTHRYVMSPTVPINDYGLYGGRYNYAIDAGDIIDSSLVMVVLNWLMRVFPMAPCRVVLETEDGLEPVKKHALTRLLKKPNPEYSGVDLWRATVLSFNWNGNAYWRKVRNSMGQVVELWYEPHWTIRPIRTNSNEFVSAYEIWRDNKWTEVPKKDIVHFRWVLNPRQQMLGLGPIDSALREIYTDNEATRFTAVLLRKLGVLGGVVTPEGDDEIDDPVQLKAMLNAISTGDERGGWGVFSRPLKMHQPNNDPSKMSTREIHMTPEERVAGLIGIHPAVVGLGAGLEHSTYNNAEEAARAAYANNIIPTYLSFGEQIDQQLVGDFTSVEDETVEFDLSKVEVLKGDIIKKEASATLMWNSNAITRAQLKIRIGEKPAADGSDDGYKHELVPGAAPAPPEGDTNPPPDMPQDALGSPEESEKALMATLIHTNGRGGH